MLYWIRWIMVVLGAPFVAFFITLILSMFVLMPCALLHIAPKDNSQLIPIFNLAGISIALLIYMVSLEKYRFGGAMLLVIWFCIPLLWSIITGQQLKPGPIRFVEAFELVETFYFCWWYLRLDKSNISMASGADWKESIKLMLAEAPFLGELIFSKKPDCPPESNRLINHEEQLSSAEDLVERKSQEKQL